MFIIELSKDEIFSNVCAYAPCLAFINVSNAY